MLNLPFLSLTNTSTINEMSEKYLYKSSFLQAMRLRDIDSTFFAKYEHRMSSGGQTPPEKDFFEPGVPDDLVKPSHIDQDSGTFKISKRLTEIRLV